MAKKKALVIGDNGNPREATNQDQLANAPPTGCVFPFAGTTAPAGALFCQGQLISRAAHADLFGVIGTTWGAGDGSTTFGLPDLRGYLYRSFVAGSVAGQVLRAIETGLQYIIII